MYLTPPSPSRTKFFANSVREASPPPSSRAQYSTKAPPNAHSNYLPALQSSAPVDMTSHHRGLPPPNPTLPDPLRSGSSRHPEYERRSEVLPPPPPSASTRPSTSYERHERHDRHERPEYQQQYAVESRPSEAYAYEELKLRQEQERTKQEDLRYRQEESKARQEEARASQRKMEQDILATAMQYQTHPNLIPLIFVGLGAATSTGFETATQYQNAVQHILMHYGNNAPFTSPKLQRDFRTTPTGPLQFGALGSQQPASGSGPHASASAPGTGVYPSPAHTSPRNSHARGMAGGISQPSPYAAPRPQSSAHSKPPSGSALPKLSTNEAQVSGGAPAGTTTQAQAGPVSQLAGQSDISSQQSPSIYFHHWQPPATQATAGKEPHKTSPKHTVTASQENVASPRKRKATGSHQPAPPPSSAPKASSPAFSSTSASSKRPGRRRESADSGTAPHPGGSRASSKERSAVTKEACRGSGQSAGESAEPSQPSSTVPSASTSTEIPPRPHS